MRPLLRRGHYYFKDTLVKGEGRRNHGGCKESTEIFILAAIYFKPFNLFLNKIYRNYFLYPLVGTVKHVLLVYWLLVYLLSRWVVSPSRRQAGGRVPVRGGADKRRQQHPATLPPLSPGREDLPTRQLPRFQERSI